jgi:erythromycin esterase-like protein
MQETSPVPEADRAALTAILPLLRQETYAPDAEVRNAARAALDRVESLLIANREALAAAHGEAEVALLERCLGNLRVYDELRALGRSGGRWKAGNLRDGRMAENLRWLAEVRYPGEKIITWAATFHQAHGLQGVTVGGNPKYYEGCRAMGEGVHETFGKECYTIGFCSHSGNAGRFVPQKTLDPPAEGSVEDRLFRYGKPLLLLNLRKSGPFDGKLPCAVMAHDRQMTARWSRVLDAIFYIEEMTPTTYMGND